ncbi:hypothetical protein ACVWXN_003511 [Bradyrhizobium sp. i1.4.4]
MWAMAHEEDLPERWSDPRCDVLRCICSNGWEGDYSLGSAFDHKPARWPQCFPAGAEGDASCTIIVVRRVDAPEQRKNRVSESRQNHREKV